MERDYWHEYRNSLPEFEHLREIPCGKDTGHSTLIRKLKRNVKTTLGNFGIFEIVRGINQLKL